MTYTWVRIATCPCTCVIDRFSRERQRSKKHCGQSARHIPPAPIRIPECLSRHAAKREFHSHTAELCCMYFYFGNKDDSLNTPLLKAAKSIWANQLTRMPCFVVYDKLHFSYTTISNLAGFHQIQHPTWTGLWEVNQWMSWGKQYLPLPSKPNCGYLDSSNDRL